MLRKTLYNALNVYRLEIHLDRKHHTDEGIKSIEKEIDYCQNYLNKDTNLIDGKWMEANANVLSKAVKCAYNLNCSERSSSSNEIEELKKCIEFFRIIYNKCNIDY